MDTQCDRHQGACGPKLCHSALCEIPPYVCPCCQECELNHEHANMTSLIGLDVLQKEVDEALADPDEIDFQSEFSSTLAELTKKTKEISMTVGEDFRKLEQLNRKLIGTQQTRAGYPFHPSSPSSCPKKANNIQQPNNSEHTKLANHCSAKHTQLEEAYRIYLKGMEELLAEFATERQTLLLEERYFDYQVQHSEKVEINVEAPVRERVYSQQIKVQRSSSDDSTEECLPIKTSSYRVEQVPRLQAIPNKPPHTEFIYIADIQPDSKDFSIVAKVNHLLSQVVSCVEIKIKKRQMMKCVLGDQTGIVTGMFIPHELFKREAVLELHQMRSYIQSGFIVLNIPKPNCVFASSEEIKTVKTGLNISGREWEKGEW